MAAFLLDPRLRADTLPLGSLGLCHLLLMKDARWPWAILVPERADILELFDLAQEDRARLTEEAARVAEALSAETGADKINLGALGNVVRQFHFHVIARSEGDPAWPGPVWGHGATQPYAAGEAEALAERLSQRLGL